MDDSLRIGLIIDSDPHPMFDTVYSYPSTAQQPLVGQDLLIIEPSRSRSVTHITFSRTSLEFIPLVIVSKLKTRQAESNQ